MNKVVGSFLVVATLFFGNSVNQVQAHDVAKELHDAFVVLLNSLDEQQRKAINFEFDDQLRKDWHFVPKERKGLAFVGTGVPWRSLCYSAGSVAAWVSRASQSARSLATM